MKLLSRSKVIYLIVFVLFLVVFVYVFRDWQSERKAYLNGHVRETERSVHAILASYHKMADFIFHTHLAVPEVESCLAAAWETDLPGFRDAMRSSLLQVLTPLYSEMVRIGFRQLHFHFPDNTSFLRFHKPGKYGDDLTEIRPTVARTNRENIRTMGFEEGRIFNGYRFVYPLSFKDLHVGSVETSISLFPVAEELSRITADEGILSATILLLRTDLVQNTVWPEEQSAYTVSAFSDRYMVDAEVSDMTSLDLKRINDSIRSRALPMMEKGLSFALPVSVRGQDSFLVEFLPKKNFDGEVVGYIVHYQQNREFAVLRRFFFLRVFSLILLTLFVLAFFVYRQRFITKLQNLATTDPLTRVSNRRYLLENLKERVYLVDRYARPHSLIMFDVDHFKDLNDGFGHALGDRVLMEIVDICRGELRTTDLLARWGGDEFVILLTETDAEKARLVAERIRQRVAERFAAEEYNVTLSLGVYQIPAGATDPDPLFARVDAALYRAKEKGRNRVEVAPESPESS